MMQGGDFTRFNGTGGESIYGAKFPDENFKLRHNVKGLLSMANSGKNTNGSQFFLTFAPCSWLDNKHVVFGRVESGYDICERIERLPTLPEDRPMKRVVISNCGEVKPLAPKQEIPKTVVPSAVPEAKQASTEETKQPPATSFPVSTDIKVEEIPQAKPVRSRSSSQSSEPKKRLSPAGSEEREKIESKSKGIKKHKKKHHKKHRKHQR